VLGVAESGYDEDLTRAPSARAIHHVRPTDQIRQVHQASDGTYGGRRVPAELTLGRGTQCQRRMYCWPLGPSASRSWPSSSPSEDSPELISFRRSGARVSAPFEPEPPEAVRRMRLDRLIDPEHE